MASTIIVAKQCLHFLTPTRYHVKYDSLCSRLLKVYVSMRSKVLLKVRYILGDWRARIEYYTVH